MKIKTLHHLFHMIISIGLCFFLWGCPSSNSGGAGAVNNPVEQENPLLVQSLAEDLETFDTCEDLETYLKEEAIAKMEAQVDENEEWYLRYQEDGFVTPGMADEAPTTFETGDGSSAPESADYSTTNVQVEGVDEADIVKNDADYIYLLSNGYFIIYNSRPGNETRELSRFEVEGSLLSMYVHNDKVVIFSQVSNVLTPPCPGDDCAVTLAPSYYPYFPMTKVTFLDIQDKAAPELMGERYIRGASYTSSRRIGNIVRVVLTSGMPLIDIKYYPADPSNLDSYDALKQENRIRIENTPLSEWIPDFDDVISSSEGEIIDSGELIECDNFYRPVDPSGYGILSIITIDLNDLTTHQNDIGLIADAHHVYASQENLYVAVSPWHWLIRPMFMTAEPAVMMPAVEYPKEILKIHKFDIGSDPTKALYTATGEVEGRLLNQYSMDEHERYLRVATTQGDTWNSTMSNNIFVLEEDQGKLNIIGEIRDIAPTERIYSARFLGDKGYLVTFKQIDPLFTLDLSVPTDPRIVGELKVPGFSTYIHPVGENHLLAIGKDTEDAGNFAWFQGIALSLFDVSDPANPTLIDKVIGSRGSDSEALRDPKAFTYFASRNLLAVPIVLYEGGTGGSDYGTYSSTGLHLYKVTPETGFEFYGMVDHTQDGCLAGLNSSYSPCDSYPSSGLRRSVIIGDAIFSISNLLMRVSSLDDLSELVDPIVFPDTPEIIWLGPAF